jgi:UDP-N-acetylmuramate--alanine ligase
MSKSIFLQPGKRAHFIGIGGIGMSALARILLHKGLWVTGSDLQESARIVYLRESGAVIHIGHRNIFKEQPDFVVYSSAISNSNSELIQARRFNIPILHRSDVLVEMVEGKRLLGVTGTHGKSTSCALASFILNRTHYEPTCLVGAEMINIRSNVFIGKSNIMVAEVDESDRSHLKVIPEIGLITNLDSDHLDVYSDMDDIKSCFSHYVRAITEKGSVVYGIDNPHLHDVVHQTVLRKSSAVSYGFSAAATWSARNIVLEGLSSKFEVFEQNQKQGTVRTKLLGMHNVNNVLGVIALLCRFGVPFEKLVEPLHEFCGIKRRLEVKRDESELLVIDDYAHHPTEVKASLAAVKSLRKRLIVVFQPHRFSRTGLLLSEFSRAFDLADQIILTEVYAANEANPNQISSELLRDALRKRGVQNVFVVKREKLITFTKEKLTQNDTVIFLGAGDIGDFSDEFAAEFEGASLA